MVRAFKKREPVMMQFQQNASVRFEYTQMKRFELQLVCPIRLAESFFGRHNFVGQTNRTLGADDG